MYYKIEIIETAKAHPHTKEFGYTMQTTRDFCDSLPEVIEYLIDHYGKLPGMKNKIYFDRYVGSPKEIGFLHSFWNRVSHDSKSWFQTDWVEIISVEEVPILAKQLKAVASKIASDCNGK